MPEKITVCAKPYASHSGSLIRLKVWSIKTGINRKVVSWLIVESVNMNKYINSLPRTNSAKPSAKKKAVGKSYNQRAGQPNNKMKSASAEMDSSSRSPI